MEIVAEAGIGDTLGLWSMYHLVAVLREVAKWVEGLYREWVERWFLE